MPVSRLAIAIGPARNPVQETNAAGKCGVDDVDAKTDRGAEAAGEGALPGRSAVWDRREESGRT
jgi:hypothetical protein